jgi:hypothetical protein
MKRFFIAASLFFFSIPALAMHKPALKKERAYLCIGWIINTYKAQIEEIAIQQEIRVKLHAGVKHPTLIQVFTNSPATLKALLIKAKIQLQTDCSE